MCLLSFILPRIPILIDSTRSLCYDDSDETIDSMMFTKGKDMDIPPSWQAILQRIIRAPAERQRLATALGVSTMTLIRWANKDSKPQRSHLTRLVQVTQSQHRTELLEALEASYPDIQSWPKDGEPEQISSEFFAQVLRARATIIESLRFWHISDMVLRQALTQLDANQLGMAITLVQCMPPSEGGKICSLRERVGRGTSPWTADLEHLAIFLGMESLAGYVVETRHVASVEDLRKRDQLLPAYQTEFEVSAAAQPIWLGGRIAGCLLASSTQPGYFSQQRLALLGAFSNIVALAFDTDDFYPPNLIALRVMPEPERQRPYLATFQQRVQQRMSEAAQSGQHMSSLEAEQHVWQELEHILLTLPEPAR